MSMTEDNLKTTQKPRGQLKLLAIIAIVVGPMLVAWILAKSGYMPGSHTNRSDLVEPVITLDDWRVELEQVGYGAPWRLLVTAPGECQEACLALLHEARQINVAIGREASRVQHLLATGDPASEIQLTQLHRDFPRMQQARLDPLAYLSSLSVHPAAWSEGPQLWLIDPLGRVVLHKDPAAPGKKLLDDLKHLLKVSKVG